MKKIISLATFVVAITTTNFAFANISEYEKYSPIKSSINATKSSYDIQFIDTMIAHHRQEILMAEMAADKSQNKEIKIKALAIIESDQADIAKLQILRDEIQEKAPVAINMRLEGMSSPDLQTLYSQSAKNFDKKFLNLMITHKNGAIEMAKEANKLAKNAKVKDASERISGEQVGEIAELKEMLKIIN